MTPLQEPKGKPWLTYEQQLDLLASRGLKITDKPAAREFLGRVGYYRFSGYFRHWQRTPTDGDNDFIDGASFEAIQTVYDAEQEFAYQCAALLHPIEHLLRARFAHYYAKHLGPVGSYVEGCGFTAPPNRSVEPVQERLLSDLDRSKEPSIVHYRDEIKDGGQYTAEAYARMPIWVATEAISFGTLSRLIEASGKSGVLDELADSMSTSRAQLPSNVRSFVHLRNRISHGARLWNHVPSHIPSMHPKTADRAKHTYGNFDDNSVFKVVVALDTLAAKCNIAHEWLATRIHPILKKSPIFAAGIFHPRKYGKMPTATLTQAITNITSPPPG